MSNSQKSKTDTPFKKSHVSSDNRAITLDNIWSLLSNTNNKVNTYDFGIKDINIKLTNLESLFIDLIKSLGKLSSDLSKVKKDNETMSSEIQILRERIT